MARTGNQTWDRATSAGTSGSPHRYHRTHLVGSLNSDGWEIPQTIVATPENDY
jgi:hypothetical protein